MQSEPARSARTTTLGVAAVATCVLVSVMSLLPVPYAVSSPGPTVDTLGEQGGTPLIEVQGAPTYPSTGELRLTTVSVSGGPRYPVDALRVLRGWFDPESYVTPVETVYPRGQTQEQIDQRNQADMVTSQEDATVAALEELGYTVPTTLTVAGTVDETGASGVLEEGDVIVALDGRDVVGYSDLTRRLAEVPAGTQVQVGVERDGQRLDVAVTTTDDGSGHSQLGVLVDPTFDLPVDVSIKINDIGGPSAGTMFALGIIDLLTPQDEAAGAIIAGTGTMDLDGSVGPIGGIRLKLEGAARDGAAWFLAPSANCDEVVGHVPDGLRVVEISTLHEAREALEAIGAGGADGLPTCS